MKAVPGSLVLAAALALAGGSVTVRTPDRVAAALAAQAQAVTPDAPPAGGDDVRFSAVDVYIDSGDQSLAAYQFELKVAAGDVTLVGVEGGDHRAFAQPPYYDTRALAGRRIILAAFDTGSDLPRGRTRVARLMVRVRGAAAPKYDASLVVAASPEARVVPAGISVVQTTPAGESAGSEGAER